VDRAAIRRLKDLLRASGGGHQEETLIHAHNLAAWQYGVLAGHHRRLIYTQHGANVHNLGLVDRLRARCLACFTDEVVAVSRATADSMARRLWIPGKRIKVVVNGVTAGRTTDRSEDEKDGARRRLSLPADAFVIGSVGRLAQVKGHDRLIKAFARGVEADVNRYSLSAIGNTKNQEPRTKNSPCLLLVGDGPERARLEQLAQDLGVSGQVIFAGYQSDPSPYYDAMDLFVLPSRSEGLSISLLEAMAAGVPVAVTDVGENKAVIEDGRCGLVLPDDEEDWKSALTPAMADLPRLAAMAGAARARVRERYSLEATLDSYEALYQGS
jgi:glycosyltransferase involved in cell wall biosynthesis